MAPTECLVAFIQNNYYKAFRVLDTRKTRQGLSQYKEEDVKEALRKGSKLVSYTET